MAKGFTLLLGTVLLAIGIWGWITGGHDHDLVVFGINTAHNLVHVLSGAAAIGMALAGERSARSFCVLFGIVYAIVAVAGFGNIASVVRMLNLNTADNYLHLAISAACLLVGFGSRSA